MSVSWGVLPVTAEVRDWLRGEGFADPGDDRSRYPTLGELLKILRSMDTWAVQVDKVGDDLREVAAGEIGTDRFAQILGTIQDDGLYHFHFFGIGNREPVMLEILHRLTPTCGPLLIFESIAATPAMITTSTTLDVVLEDWLARIRRTYDEADARNHAGT